MDRVNLAWRLALLPKGRMAARDHILMRAVKETLRNITSADERAQWMRIENYRRGLLQDEREIEFVDYGAGPRSGQQGAAAGSEGVRSTRRISQIALASKSSLWGKLLYKSVRFAGARTCLELGTSLAISASYIASALPREGRLVTMEGSPAVAAMAADTLKALVPDRRVEVRLGPFNDTLDQTLREVAPLDFVFVDGHHDEAATGRYFRQLLPRMEPGGVMVFDDIRWSGGMRKAWRRIRGEMPRHCLDLGAVGIVRVG
jgi:predicted O-methyltransferase YrrM